MSDAATTVTLRALTGSPLADEPVRAMVEATAAAIAERQGIDLLDHHTSPTSITVTLETGQIQAIGFAAELRRLTGNWYSHKYGGDLWGEVHCGDDGQDGHDGDDDESEAWKHA